VSRLDKDTPARFEREREVRVGRKRTLPIWIVVVDGDAYVRSYHGERGRWYRRARVSRRVVIDGVEYGVEPVTDPALNERISEAYRAKYGQRSPGPTAAMAAPEVVATTLRVVAP
jgi:hypothetical protein